MTITSELERLDTGDSEGCKYRGYHREVISGKENTIYPYILKPEESGALCVHGAAGGAQWELPPAEAGLWYEFLATVSVTASDTYVIATSVATAGDFLAGVIVGGNLTIGASGDPFTGDGSTHLTITQNGSTTGGLIGDSFVLTAISGAIWVLTQGVSVGSGTNLTPFTT
jgi:hypothetical protein